jgi:hypothetical protein
MKFGKPHTDDQDPYAAAGNRTGLLLRLGFLALVFAALAAVYALSQFRGLHDPVAMESAQIARHLAEGRGFVTDCARPFDLWYLQAHERLPAAEAPIPVLWTAPGLPLLQAGLLRLVRPAYAADTAGGGRLMPAETRVLVPLGVGLLLLTVLAVWLLASELFGERVALPAAAAYAVSDLALAGSLSGLPLTLASPAWMLGLWLAILAVRRSATPERGWGVAGLTLLAGLCTAVAVLADYTMLVAALAVAALLGMELQRRRWLLLPLFVLVVLLVLAPWLLRNLAAGTGILGAWPYAALRETALFPGDALERSAAPVFNAYRSSAAIRQGLAARLMALFSGTGFVRGGVMLCFFMLALFQRSEQSFVRALKGLAVAALLLLALLPPVPGAVAGAGWMALYPLMVVFGMAAFLQALDHEEFFDAAVRPLLMGLLLVLCLLPAGLRMLRGAASAYPPYYAPIQQFVGGVPGEGELLLTDIPWATAWYGGCKSVLLPNKPEDVDALAGAGWEKVGGLYLTGTTGGESGDAAWLLMRLARQVPESVPLRSGVSLPVGRTDQLLLTREERWQAE